MADKVICNKSDLVNIANSVRTKLGVTNPYYVSDLSGAIDSISTGSTPRLQSKSVTYTSNGTSTITPNSGYDGLSSVNVTVDVSGGGGEICTLTTSVGKSPGVVHGTIYAYYGDTLITITSKGTYSVNKNSIICIQGANGLDLYTGLEQLSGQEGISAYNVISNTATYKFDS